MIFSSRTALLALLPLALVACSDAEGAASEDDHAFTSAEATLVDFEFDGEVVASNLLDARQAVRAQLFFTVGQLNAENSVGRVEIADVKVTERASTVIRYHAKLPVAWHKDKEIPSTYELVLPRNLDDARGFEERSRGSCAVDGDDGSHDYWYEFRPKSSRCRFEAADVVRAQATVSVSPLNMEEQYPEYHRVWEDGRFESIAIFAKDVANGGASDQGVAGFNTYIRSLRRELEGATVTTTPSDLADRPGPDTRDVTFEGSFPDGRKFKISLFLLDAMRSPWAGFEERYESLTPTADFIAYNGHAGLGGNIQALAKMGSWKNDKYLVFFMNGCNTFAYIDGTLPKARGAGGSDDPNGTRNLEFITNAMPAYFHDLPEATSSIFRALLNPDSPKSYREMLHDVPSAGVAVVNGDEDNVFRPGMPVRPGH